MRFRVGAREAHHEREKVVKRGRQGIDLCHIYRQTTRPRGYVAQLVRAQHS